MTRRAWAIYAKRFPQLGEFDMVITKAVVRGKTYYRVSAGGLQRAEAGTEVVVTNTLPLKEDEPRSKIQTLNIAPILASTIKNVFTDESVSEVFMGENQLF